MVKRVGESIAVFCMLYIFHQRFSGFSQNAFGIEWFNMMTTLYIYVWILMYFYRMINIKKKQ